MRNAHGTLRQTVPWAFLRTKNVIVVKTYEISTPEKKRVRNRGERKKYYAVGTHPAIITQEQFDLIQAERKARTNLETTGSGKKRKSTRYSSK